MSITLNLKSKKNKLWLPAELLCLKKMAGKYEPEEIAEAMNWTCNNKRNRGSVKNIASKYGYPLSIKKPLN